MMTVKHGQPPYPDTISIHAVTSKSTIPFPHGFVTTDQQVFHGDLAPWPPPTSASSEPAPRRAD
ncbi:hypothetical protein HMPREF1979_00051, partial [Actinomyces johnsonii F0542]